MKHQKTSTENFRGKGSYKPAKEFSSAYEIQKHEKKKDSIHRKAVTTDNQKIHGSLKEDETFKRNKVHC